MQRVRHANWQVYGAFKGWKQMHREGLPIAHWTAQRLMRKLGLEGARRDKRVRTTHPDAARPYPLDLVNRQFTSQHPEQLWVADFTYVSTWQGKCHRTEAGWVPAA
ncbi:IS3 family transposase [Comamonas aquatica]|nr:IS3 family transposase [Comamonas aquatica]